jgi:hypothetical protein
MEQDSRMESLRQRRDAAFSQRNIRIKSKHKESYESLEKLAHDIRQIYDESGIYCALIQEIRWAANNVFRPSSLEYLYRARGLAMQYLAGLIENNKGLKESGIEILSEQQLTHLQYILRGDRQQQAITDHISIKTRYLHTKTQDTISFFFYGHV